MRHKPERPRDNANPDKDKKSSEKESTNRHVYIEPGVQIDFVQDLRKQYETAQSDDKAHKDAQLSWTKVAAALLLLTAAFTASQLLLTRSQFQKDQRPYLWILDYASGRDFHLVENDKMWISFSMVDYGKSPAIGVRSAGKIFVGTDAMLQADKWFADFDAGKGTYMAGETIVPPGIPADPAKHYTYFTSWTDEPLTHDQFAYIINTDQPVAMVMRMKYSDIAGNNYGSEVCLSRAVNGSLPHCGRHNVMK